MTSPGWVRVGGVATVCALAGAGAGIAGSTAATSSTTTTAKTAKAAKPPARTAPAGRPGPGFGRHLVLRGGPPVHEEAVVLDKAGKAYITVTSDNGTVRSVSGDELVIAEGTKTVPYKDVTVTIPGGATITRNGKTAKLSDLKAGDHVHVSSSSDGTVVFAADDSFRPGPGRGRGPGGPGFGPGGHHGPPPAGAYPGPPTTP